VAVAQGPRALTARETEVLRRASDGQTLKEIAYGMGVSYSTVRVLVCRLRRRLGVSTTAAAIAIWERVRGA
jgi:DNA-binding CsgD family transcriptional regulator